MRYVDVLGGVVTNVVNWDGATPYTPTDGGTLIQSNTAQVGYTYSAGVFTFGSPPASGYTPRPTTSVGNPNPRTLTVSTAYQASDPSRPAVVTINMAASAALNLTTGTNNLANILMGPTAAVATGSGTVVGQFSNSLTGTLVVGLGVNSGNVNTVVMNLPVGWYFAVIPIGGAVTMATVVDQSLGTLQ